MVPGNAAPSSRSGAGYAISEGGVSPIPAMPLCRRILLLLLSAALTVAALLPLGLLSGRPPTVPQLTFIGTHGVGNDGTLNLLLEGAGGGRVLIGGGENGADLPAALARTALPWQGRLDLLIVADRRDLPGATELVRRGQVAQVAIVGRVEERVAVAALSALREVCTARGIPLRTIEQGERIAVGRAGGLALDILPPQHGGDAPYLRLEAGGLSAAIAAGSTAPTAPTLLAIVPRGSLDAYRAALAGTPRIVVVPAASATMLASATIDARVLLIAPGQRATIVVAGTTLQLRGATLTPLLSSEGR